MTTQWRASVLYASAPTPISDDQADILMANLPGYGIAKQEGNRIRLDMTVEASTLRRATDEALKAAAAAYGEAFDVVGMAIGITVRTAEDDERELTKPSKMDLISIAEIAEKARVSRQRAHQLLDLPSFPTPVAEPRAGKIFTERSVDHFIEHWDRRTGRPSKAG